MSGAEDAEGSGENWLSLSTSSFVRGGGEIIATRFRDVQDLQRGSMWVGDFGDGGGGVDCMTISGQYVPRTYMCKVASRLQTGACFSLREDC